MANKANIQYIGKVEKKGVMVAGDPFESYRTGNQTIELPKDQSKPFYHERANDIIMQWPHLYKAFVEKGTLKAKRKTKKG